MKLNQMLSNSVIITPSSLKRKLLKKISQNVMLNTKVITIEELRQKFYFTYDEQAIYYLMEKYGYQIDVAKMYISKMYEVEDNDFDSTKIKKIIELKKELIANKLLKVSDNFISFLKSKILLLYGWQLLTKNDEKLFLDRK